MDQLTQPILRLLAREGRISAAELATRLAIDEATAAAAMAKLEHDHIIYGYQAIYDESRLPELKVKAVIEVKIRPERDGGFDRLAHRLARFPQVSALYLISGSFDLLLEVRGESLESVAMFVASKLATVEGVLSTATHFILKKYKESGRLLEEEPCDERLQVTP